MPQRRQVFTRRLLFKSRFAPIPAGVHLFAGLIPRHQTRSARAAVATTQKAPFCLPAGWATQVCLSGESADRVAPADEFRKTFMYMQTRGEPNVTSRIQRSKFERTDPHNCFHHRTMAGSVFLAGAIKLRSPGAKPGPFA